MDHILEAIETGRCFSWLDAPRYVQSGPQRFAQWIWARCVLTK